jgi:hypothetical protein
MFSFVLKNLDRWVIKKKIVLVVYEDPNFFAYMQRGLHLNLAMAIYI